MGFAGGQVYEMPTIQPIGSSALVNERVGDFTPIEDITGEQSGPTSQGARRPSPYQA